MVDRTDADDDDDAAGVDEDRFEGVPTKVDMKQPLGGVGEEPRSPFSTLSCSIRPSVREEATTETLS